MPNRIIKESICTSEDVAKLSMGAEVLFYHLIVKADDYGVYFGNEQIIRSTCYPLKTDEIKLKQVESWLNELVSAGLVNAYIAEDGKKYIQFAKWAKHQQIRAKRSKYPTMDDSCNQLIADDCKCPRNPIQSNPIEIQSKSAQSANNGGFEAFWTAYPKKKSKGQALSAWKKLKPDSSLQALILKAVEAQKRSPDWQKDKGKYIPYPATWLNAMAWEDEVPTEQKRREVQYLP